MLDPQSDPEVPYAVWVALYTSFTNNLYYVLVGLTFVVYEYIITFDREVSLFWRRRFTGATLLFLLNRYITLLTQLLDSLTTSKLLRSDKSCSLFNQVGFAIDISQYIVWAAFAALRALALSRYKLLSAFIFILSLMPVGINFAKYGFQYEGDVVDIFNFKGCSGLDFVPDALQRKFVITSRTSLIAADVILVLITWYTLPVKTIFKPNPSRVVGGNQRSSIASTLLQNGTRYFLVLITLNTLHLVFTIAQVFEIAAGGNFSQLTIFTEPATSILVSRFLFNLQEASRETCDQVESDDVTGSSVVFGNGSSSTIDRVLGSIGSSLISTGSVDGRQDESDAIQAEETGPDGGSQRLETATN